MSASEQSADQVSTVLVEELRPGIFLASLNRPDRANAMTNTMFAELEDVARSLGSSRRARVLIITGAGFAFCGGYDLDDAEVLPTLSTAQALDQQELAARALGAVRALGIPVIAAVNGAAAGGGLSLALAADIRIASPKAKFNAAFVRIGLSAGDLGASWLLPRLIGTGAAAEIAFTGRMVHADEAERIGLVNRVVPEDELLECCGQLADQIVANS
ncbi:MAG: enoyl-CoA hydratase/carnithine racemase, partial [Marmoricola sp.]|nr:enoyl-CoA hydratase/carnithine racemase [Marmoricola sp.]